MRQVVLILGLCLPFGIAYGQTFGQITGEVRDPSGAVVASAAVTATNVATNVARDTTTNQAGVYTFPDLIPATYQVKVTAPGFQVTTSTVEIQVQQTARVDFTLNVGQATQTVEVSAAAAALTTESATVGTVIAQKTINDLPLNGRNFLQLVAVAPNVSYGFAAASQASSREGGDRGSNLYTISVAGMRSTFNEYSLDGVADTDPDFNEYIQVPSIDALQEFKVQSGIYPAEFGREAVQINVSTKSGTNDFHGTGFEFLRNSDFDADPYNFSGVATKNPFKQNQYGYYLGGPVWIPKLFNGKNKLFFMSNWEGYKSRLTNTDTYTVPTAAWRSGDFSAFPTVLYDPNTRVLGANGVYTATPFPGNIIPTNRLDPTSQALYAFLPLPNVNPGNSTNPSNNLNIPEETQVNKNQVTERIDYNQSSNMQWFGRFGWTSENTITPTLPQIGGSLATNSKQYMISNAWVLSPTKVNEFRFGYTTLYNAVQQILSGKEDVVHQLGLPYPAEAPQSWGVPSVSLALNGLSGFGDNTNGPFVINDNIREALDNFSWNIGKHSLRFGGEYRYDIYNQFGNQYTRSQLQFNGEYTANPANLAGGNAAADMDLGNLYRVDLALQVASANDTANSVAAYIDDTYKLTPKITVTVGLRWELEQPWLDTQQNMTNFQFKTGLPQQANVDPSLYPILTRAGTNGNFYQGLDYIYVNTTGYGQPGPVPVQRNGALGARMVNTDYHNFAPRFGIAYSPTSKWSIRTGFGIFYSLDSQNSRFDENRATAGRLTDLPAPNAPPTLTYQNSLNAAILPVSINPGLTWAIEQNIGVPYSMMYLLNVQRQLGTNSTLEVGYQGVEDRHLNNQLNMDAGIPNGTAAAPSHVPYPMYYSGIEYTEGYGIGNYNALSTKLTQRYNSGLTTLIAFTWSKALDNGSAIRGSTGDQYPENPYCVIACEYGPSGFNTPLRLVASVLYELPFGRGKRFINQGGVMDRIVGGWQFTTILTAQSGRPLNTVSWDAAGQVIQPNANRLNSTGISPYASNADQHQWFNLSGFSNVVAATCVGTITPGCYNDSFGNMQRNGLIGPSVWTADASLFKNIHITERQMLQLRLEVFNALNHVALNSPNVAWGTTTQTPAATFGQITNSGSTLGTAYAMREVQIAAKYVF